MPEEQIKACNVDVFGACPSESSGIGAECNWGCLQAACKAYRRQIAGTVAFCSMSEFNGSALTAQEIEQTVLGAATGCSKFPDNGPMASVDANKSVAEQICDKALGLQCAHVLGLACGDGNHCAEECSTVVCDVRLHLTSPKVSSIKWYCTTMQQCSAIFICD